MALAIALKNRWHDPFFRAKTIVTLLQIGFAGVILIFAYILYNYLHENTLRILVSSIIGGTVPSSLEAGDNLLVSLQLVKSKNFFVFSAIMLAFAAFFTFLITKLTLKPAKTTLEAQKRFISAIAHELRTPLSVIKTNSEVALMDKNIERGIKKMLKDNVEELDRMAEIINNTLSFNKLLRPESIKFSNINLGPIVDSSVQKLKALAEKKDLNITVKKSLPNIVWGNAVALEQVVTNLLKNSINYTSRKGHITVTVNPNEFNNVVLTIEDTGIGISKKDLMHIFEPFYRAERSRNRNSGSSSGLGLSIVGELVKIHSGSLTIKSSKNKGTTAIVTLPYGKKIYALDNGGEISIGSPS